MSSRLSTDNHTPCHIRNASEAINHQGLGVIPTIDGAIGGGGSITREVREGLEHFTPLRLASISLRWELGQCVLGEHGNFGRNIVEVVKAGGSRGDVVPVEFFNREVPAFHRYEEGVNPRRFGY